MNKKWILKMVAGSIYFVLAIVSIIFAIMSLTIYNLEVL
jgi:hypothetical protein